MDMGQANILVTLYQAKAECLLTRSLSFFERFVVGELSILVSLNQAKASVY